MTFLLTHVNLTFGIKIYKKQQIVLAARTIKPKDFAKRPNFAHGDQILPIL